MTSVIGLSVLFLLYGTQPGFAETWKQSEQDVKGTAQQQSQLSAKLVQNPPPTIELDSLKERYQRPVAVPFPEDNAPSQARELLGRTLFFDPRLSGSNWIACATCHNPGLAWGDGLPRAIGHGMQVLGRRTPTILNLAWAEALFWDGRAASLEEQALGPIQAPGEMNQPLESLVEKLQAIPEYHPLFHKAYPNEPISAATMAKALATFERTVVSDQAPFDRWIEGEEDAISKAAKRGFVVFNAQARCSQCHSTWRFTDDSFHDIGVASDDQGRGTLLAGIPAMQHAFKTPTLRNVNRRAPYMHNGSESTLEQVIDFYAQGGRLQRPSLSSEIRPLPLTADDQNDLIAFLHTLTSDDKPLVMPTLPR